MTQTAHDPLRCKVLVVGDDPILRGGIAQYLRLINSSARVSEASSGLEVAGVAGDSAWDLIVLDSEGTGDLARLNHLKQAQPDVPVLVLNLDATPADARAAIAAGAAGYLGRGSPVREWQLAVETVVAGGVYPSTSGPAI
jgi:DNA-binding NarL/FixJ family response regulator